MRYRRYTSPCQPPAATAASCTTTSSLTLPAVPLQAHLCDSKAPGKAHQAVGYCNCSAPAEGVVCSAAAQEWKRGPAAAGFQRSAAMQLTACCSTCRRRLRALASISCLVLAVRCFAAYEPLLVCVAKMALPGTRRIYNDIIFIGFPAQAAKGSRGAKAHKLSLSPWLSLSDGMSRMGNRWPMLMVPYLHPLLPAGRLEGLRCDR